MGYLLTWNGNQENYSDGELRKLIRATSGERTHKGWWSAGSRTTPLPPGSRVFLLRQGSDRGVFGSGYLVDGVIHHESVNWGSMIRVDFDTAVPIADRLRRETLMAADPTGSWCRAQASCTLLQPKHEKLLEKLWERHLRQLGRAPFRSS